MKRVLIKIISFTIVIGVLGLCFNLAFGNNTITYIYKEQIRLNTQITWTMWKFNFWAYFKNLQLSTTDLSILIFDLPQRQWNNNMDWNALGNNLLVMLDYVIVIINIILYPFKIGAYLLRNLLAILGVNTDTTQEGNGLAWLITFVNNILANFTIPYI